MSMFGNILGAALGGGGGSGGGNPIQSMIVNMLSEPGADPSSPTAGGLGGLVQKFEAAGAGPIVQSWISQGSNLGITPDMLQHVLGNDHVQALASKAGVDPQMLLSLLSQHLPGAVDQMTPQGTLPTAQA